MFKANVHARVLGETEFQRVGIIELAAVPREGEYVERIDEHWIPVYEVAAVAHPTPKKDWDVELWLDQIEPIGGMDVLMKGGTLDVFHEYVEDKTVALGPFIALVKELLILGPDFAQLADADKEKVRAIGRSLEEMSREHHLEGSEFMYAASQIVFLMTGNNSELGHLWHGIGGWLD